MKEEKLVRCQELMPAIGEILNKGRHVRLTVTGNSMFPFLRSGVDSVDLMDPSNVTLRRGDIVLTLKGTNQYVLHRVASIHDHCYYIVGDAQDVREGPFSYDRVVALVNGIWRKDRYIPASDSVLRFLSALWLRLRPFRRYLLHLIHWLYNLKRKWFSSSSE